MMAFLFLLTTIHCEIDPAVEGISLVTHMTKETFLPTVTADLTKKFFFVAYSPICPNCKKFMPIFYSLAYTLRDEEITFVMINCLEEEDLCRMLQVKNYPYLFAIKNKNMNIYLGKKGMKLLTKFILEERPGVYDYVVPEVMPGFFEELGLGLKEMYRDIVWILQNEGFKMQLFVIGFLIAMSSCIIAVIYMCMKACCCIDDGFTKSKFD